MSYSNYTSLFKLKKTFGLTINDRRSLFMDRPAQPPSEDLQRELAIKLPLGLKLSNEKARSELIISPILVELLRTDGDRISLFSGVEFEVDAAQGLNGVCDFLLSRSPNQVMIEEPVVAIVEAKREDLIAGVPQCLAEMIAARIFNEAAGRPQEAIYGAVTTGGEWRFLMLDGATAYVDSDEYFIAELSKILGILRSIVAPPRQSEPFPL